MDCNARILSRTAIDAESPGFTALDSAKEEAPRKAAPSWRPGHIQAVDVLRGLAVTAVFLYHAVYIAFGTVRLPWAGWHPDFTADPGLVAVLPLTAGYLGVAVFFAVSGFCIHLAHSKTRCWRVFTCRRFFRIYPAYLAAVVLFAVVLPWTKLDSESHLIPQLVSHLSLAHNFSSRCFYGINPSFWSIAVEVQLYLLYPILLGGASRLGWGRFLLVLAAVELGIRLAMGICANSGMLVSRWVEGLPLTYWFSWAVGAYVFELLARGDGMPGFLRVPLSWATLAVAFSFLRPLTPLAFTCGSLATAGLLARNQRREAAVASRPRKPLAQICAYLGLVSYSFYLVHQPLMDIVARAFRRWCPAFDGPFDVGLVLLLTFPFLVAAAAAGYKLLEAPFVALGRQAENLPLVRRGDN